MQDEIDKSGVWLSLSEVARRRGISRASVKERVDRLETQGLVTTRRDGKRRLVELATFDRATGNTANQAKELAAETVRFAGSETSSEYRDAQAERARYEAQLKALDLAERRGQLLPIAGPHGIDAAVQQCGIALAREFDGIVRYADEITGATNREGVTGARRVLKNIARNLRERSAAAFGRIADEGVAAERQGPIETELPIIYPETEGSEQ